MAEVKRTLRYTETISQDDPVGEIVRCLEQFVSLGGDATDCEISVRTDKVESGRVFDAEPTILRAWTHLRIEGDARG